MKKPFHQFRKQSKGYYSLRVFIYKNGKQVAISPKHYRSLGEVNDYLKLKGLGPEEAMQDEHFLQLKSKIYSDLKVRENLYWIEKEKELELKTAKFNFEKALILFEKEKSKYSVAREYRSCMEKFWLPFFLVEKGCEHPSEFKAYADEAEQLVLNAKTRTGRPYSHNSYHALTKPINQFMDMCKKEGYISRSEHFRVDVELTLHQLKLSAMKGVVKHNARASTLYSIDDLRLIKNKIDGYEATDSEKVELYAIYLGMCLGLRKGNILGLRARNLILGKPAYVEVEAEVISGWRMYEKGAIELRATKTTFDQTHRLPFLCPSHKELVSVAKYLKASIQPDDRLLPIAPDTLNKKWKKWCRVLEVKYISPHRWRHSFSTIAANHLNEWFGGNRLKLQYVAMHEDYRTTDKYVHQDTKSMTEWYKSLE